MYNWKSYFECNGKEASSSPSTPLVQEKTDSEENTSHKEQSSSPTTDTTDNAQLNILMQIGNSNDVDFQISKGQLGTTQCAECVSLQKELMNQQAQSRRSLQILKQKLMSTGDLISEYHRKCQELEKSKQTGIELKNKLDTCYGETGSLRIQLQRAHEANEPLKKTIARLEHKIETLQSEARVFNKQLDMKEAHILEIQRSMQSSRLTNELLKKKTTDTEKNHAKDTSRINNQDKLLEKLNQQLKRLRDQHKGDVISLRKANNHLNKAQNKINKLETKQRRIGKESSLRGVLSPSPSPPHSPIRKRLRKRKSTAILYSKDDGSENDKSSSDDSQTGAELQRLLQNTLPIQRSSNPLPFLFRTFLSPPLSPIPPSPEPSFQNRIHNTRNHSPLIVAPLEILSQTDGNLSDDDPEIDPNSELSNHSTMKEVNKESICNNVSNQGNDTKSPTFEQNNTNTEFCEKLETCNDLNKLFGQDGLIVTQSDVSCSSLEQISKKPAVDAVVKVQQEANLEEAIVSNDRSEECEKDETKPLSNNLQVRSDDEDKEHMCDNEKLDLHDSPHNLVDEAETLSQIQQGDETMTCNSQHQADNSQDITKADSSQDVTKADSSQDVTKASSSQDVTKADSSQDVTKASSSQDVTKASSSQDVTKASSSQDVTKASSSQDITKAVCLQNVTKASSSQDVTKAVCLQNVTKASSSQDVTKASSSQVSTKQVSPLKNCIFATKDGQDTFKDPDEFDFVIERVPERSGENEVNSDLHSECQHVSDATVYDAVIKDDVSVAAQATFDSSGAISGSTHSLTAIDTSSVSTFSNRESAVLSDRIETPQLVLQHQIITRRHSMFTHVAPLLSAPSLRIDRTRSLSPSMFSLPSPPLSPLPPSPQRSLLTPIMSPQPHVSSEESSPITSSYTAQRSHLTPVISPLPQTPLPESVSPLPPSPTVITSPPLIRGSALQRTENSFVVAPKPVSRKRSQAERNLNFPSMKVDSPNGIVNYPKRHIKQTEIGFAFGLLAKYFNCSLNKQRLMAALSDISNTSVVSISKAIVKHTTANGSETVHSILKRLACSSQADQSEDASAERRIFLLNHPQSALIGDVLTDYERSIAEIVDVLRRKHHLKKLCSLLCKQSLFALVDTTGQMLSCEMLALCRLHALVCKITNRLSDLENFLYTLAFDQIPHINFAMFFITCYAVLPPVLLRCDLITRNAEGWVLHLVKLSPLSAVLPVIAANDAFIRKDSTCLKILDLIFPLKSSDDVQTLFEPLAYELFSLICNKELCFMERNRDNNELNLCPYAQSTHKSLLLVCKKLGWEWTYNKLIASIIMDFFKTTVGDVNCHLDTVVVVIRVIGSLCHMGVNFGFCDFAELIDLLVATIPPKCKVSIGETFELAVIRTLIEIEPRVSSKLKLHLIQWMESPRDFTIPPVLNKRLVRLTKTS